MRNLIQLSARSYSGPSDSCIEAIAYPPDQDQFGSVYSCSSLSNSSTDDDADDEITISIHIINPIPHSNSTSNPTSSTNHDHSQTLLAQFNTNRPSSSSSSNPKCNPPLILSFQHLSDSGSTFDSKPALSIITSTGDLVLLPLSRDSLSVDQEYLKDQSQEDPQLTIPTATVLGSVSDGILDAKWSPDLELLVLVVPDNDGREQEEEGEGEQQTLQDGKLKTILMNLDFDIISEGPLQVDQFGEDAPVDVGWGSKATQFHGSEGKAAAAAAAAAASKASSNDTNSSSSKPVKNPRGTITSDDDFLPHISWRNDGSFFFISSLDRFIPGGSKIEEISDENLNHQRNGNSDNRIIRIFNRNGGLSCSSEEIKGLSHCLNVRPTGNIVASSQRFGTGKRRIPFFGNKEEEEEIEFDWGKGRNTRHDIVFFERNGLRHGEFSLREEENEKPKKNQEEEKENQIQQIDHEIKGLKWNSDGNALGIWIKRFYSNGFKKDFIQIWTTMNYHWYLKTELSVPSTTSSSSSSFSSKDEIKSFSFHPTLPFQINLQTSKEIFIFNHQLSTISSGFNDQKPCVNSVIDGKEIKIYPFSLSNTPPPFSALSLNLTQEQLGIGNEMCIRNTCWSDVQIEKDQEIQESGSIIAILGKDKISFFNYNWGNMDIKISTSSEDRENKIGKLDKIKGPFDLGSHSIDNPRFNPRQVSMEVESLEDKIIIKLAVLGNQYSNKDEADLVENDTLKVLVFETALSNNQSSEKTLKILNERDFDLGITNEKKLISRRIKASSSKAQKGEELVFVISGSKGELWSFNQNQSSNSDEIFFKLDALVPLPSFCPHLEILPDFRSSEEIKKDENDSGNRIVGLSNNGILYLSYGEKTPSKGRRNESSGSGSTHHKILARDSTSFLISGNFLIWTDVSHLGNFLTLSSLFSTSSNENSKLSIEQTKLVRNLERGSFLIASVPTNMTLILQMPRGNLEIIYPRPLVLEIVKDQLDQRRYGNSVRICRTHRIDLNLIVDYDRKGKGRNPNSNSIGQGSGLLGLGDEKEVRKFVRGVREIDHLNLFLSGLKNSDVTKTMYKFVPGFYSIEEQNQITNSEKLKKQEDFDSMNGNPSSSSLTLSSTLNQAKLNDSTEEVSLLQNKVNRICDSLRKELQRIDQIKYLNSILTTYIKKTPSDYESALNLLLSLKNSNQISTSLTESSITYMIFLSDGDELFKVALGMYDFTLTLLIAQNSSKKDPREYLPFLRTLKEIQPLEFQKFKIDDYLERREKAFHWLAIGCKDKDKDENGEKFEFAMDYLEKYGLWKLGLIEWKNNRFKVEKVRESYGDHLMSKKKPEEAAVAFTLARKPRKALKAYLEATLWQEALTLLKSENFPQSEILNFSRNISETLENLNKFSEAGEVLYEHSPGDLEESVRLFCKANLFSKVKRICQKSNRLDLLETHLRNSLLESGGNLKDEIGEMKDQLVKQLNRIKELKIKKEENPNGFYLDEDPALENLDVMSDTSTQITQFTRYTAATSGAASLLSSSSGQSTAFMNRKKTKKEEKKKNQGKKGSVWEEGYLYDSLQKLLKEKLQEIQTETSRILPHLIAESTNHRKLAQTLQDSLSSFESLAISGVENLWKETQEEEHNRIVSIFEEQRLEQEKQNFNRGENPNTSSFTPVGSLTILQVNALCAARDRAARPKIQVATVDWKCRALDILNAA